MRGSGWGPAGLRLLLAEELRLEIGDVVLDVGWDTAQLTLRVAPERWIPDQRARPHPRVHPLAISVGWRARWGTADPAIRHMPLLRAARRAPTSSALPERPPNRQRPQL
jgi:hypothetical protein